MIVICSNLNSNLQDTQEMMAQKMLENCCKTLCSCCNLPAQENIKLLKPLKYGFKVATNWNKYLATIKNQAKNIFRL